LFYAFCGQKRREIEHEKEERRDEQQAKEDRQINTTF